MGHGCRDGPGARSVRFQGSTRGTVAESITEIRHFLSPTDVVGVNV